VLFTIVVLIGGQTRAEFSDELWETPEPVSAGTSHACAVRGNGTVVCWGNDSYGQSTPPEGTFMQVSVGQKHTCGVRTDGTVVC
jgi:alpha-tubulin suppressor-like RCC1 family protein